MRKSLLALGVAALLAIPAVAVAQTNPAPAKPAATARPSATAGAPHKTMAKKHMVKHHAKKHKAKKHTAKKHTAKKHASSMAKKPAAAPANGAAPASK